jgi:protein required for attachment to host cells
MNTTWILVANRARAHLWNYNANDQSITPVDDIPHPKGRAKDSEIATDRNHDSNDRGNSFDGMGAGQRTMDPQQSPTERDTEMWAADLAERLRKERGRGAFDNLVLMADPSMLGEIRNKLDQATDHTVVVTIDINVGHGDPQDAKVQQAVERALEPHHEELAAVAT